MAFKTFTSGAVLTAAEVNTYLMQQAVIVCTAATRPSAPVEGMHISETDTDLEYVYNGSAWVLWGGFGAWVSYTPTITGWAIGNGTISTSYFKIGRYVTCRGTITAGSTTTFAANLGVPTPVAPLIFHTAGATGLAQDASAGVYYPLHVFVDTASSGKLNFSPVATGAAYATLDNNGVLDTTFPFDWTTSDTVQWIVTYEAAS